jgi:hypothetical protein
MPFGCNKCSAKRNKEAGPTPPGNHRVSLSKASARELHRTQNASSTRKPSRRASPVGLGFRVVGRACADCFRSQSVASALDIRPGATPCGQSQPNNFTLRRCRSVTSYMTQPTPVSVTWINDLTGGRPHSSADCRREGHQCASTSDGSSCTLPNANRWMCAQYPWGRRMGPIPKTPPGASRRATWQRCGRSDGLAYVSSRFPTRSELHAP